MLNASGARIEEKCKKRKKMGKKNKREREREKEIKRKEWNFQLGRVLHSSVSRFIFEIIRELNRNLLIPSAIRFIR